MLWNTLAAVGLIYVVGIVVAFITLRVQSVFQDDKSFKTTVLLDAVFALSWPVLLYALCVEIIDRTKKKK